MIAFRTILQIALVTGIVAGPGSGVAGRAGAATVPQTASATPSDGALPSVEDVVGAWSIARQWVDRYSVPREHDGDAAVVIRNASALSLVLRANGAIVGRATIAPVDGLALRRATSRAMGEALGSIRSAVEAGGDQVGSRLTLELEVAGPPTPLLGRTVAEAAQRVRPGLDGLAMRRGERWEHAFPGRLLASNTAANPAATIGSLATDLDLPVRDLAELREIDDVSLYRFDTVRLVQLGPGETPTTLLRGDEIVASASITRESTARLAAEIATRLIRTAQREGSGEPAKWFRGAYRAIADDHRPPVATLFEQALCCLALLQLADSSALDVLPRVEREQVTTACTETALAVLETLALDPPAALVMSDMGDEDPFAERRTAAAAALAVMTIDRDDRAPWLEQLLRWTLDRAAGDSDSRTGDDTARGRAIARGRAGSRGGVGAGVVDPAGDELREGSDSPLDLALAAAALARAARLGEAAIEPEAATRLVAAAWASIPADLHVSLLPWLVWAERDLLALELEGHAEGDAPASQEDRRARLIALREQILAFQAGYGEGLADVPADLFGGFVLVGAPPPFAPPFVTAQSLRPLAGLGALFAEEAWTPAPARDPLWRRHLAGVRFLTQLVVRPPVDSLSRRPLSARWGVRQAPWDSEQPVAAQAMALFALIETLAAWPANRPDAPASTP